MVLMGALCLFRRVLDSDRNSIIERDRYLSPRFVWFAERYGFKLLRLHERFRTLCFLMDIGSPRGLGDGGTKVINHLRGKSGYDIKNLLRVFILRNEFVFRGRRNVP